ncbi:acetoacetate metabolism regulatory protein AtoC [Desulfosarcina ovata subsp. sediminis]|uniref:Acetoacetate metabolism regulatory protein AtoC n=1 Tax=Desulfosarcina ovata subsp. sediminis TaxID=885957 RepID=A0A5K7ZQ79_9BACT|nr:sigma-54 dependent transcriptional regulator [Desulfosarcina ovata]BBO82259.1 acetoacetate metabolism regulatory protein AtoC [Desulfosarcina ovata subsp. sediminis]
MHPSVLIIACDGRPSDFMADPSLSRNFTWVHTTPGESVVAAMDRHQPGLVLVYSGTAANSRVLASVSHIKRRFPTTSVFLVARESSESLAIGALKAGVDDYFKYPLRAKALLARIEQKLGLDNENLSKSTLSKDASKGHFPGKLIGESRIMEEINGLLERIAIVDSTVLITGETGTGKELAAGIIHTKSTRTRQPMVSVNCAALPDSLVESELFGYEKGAFTGAVTPTRGRFEQARGGTVFLDEIGDMTSLAQAKILRVIEEKAISPLGGGDPRPLDFRLVAATNRDPETLIAEGVFREDLFYRLNVARVHMPSLREHPEDLPSLVAHAIDCLNLKFGRKVKGLSTAAMDALGQHSWPGNVRELMNLLEATYINMPADTIHFADLPVQFQRCLEDSRHMPENERAAILSALMETNWNKSTAARKLNWSRMTLYRKMAKHRIVEERRHP